MLDPQVKQAIRAWLPYRAGLMQVTDIGAGWLVYYRDSEGEKCFVTLDKRDYSVIEHY